MAFPYIFFSIFLTAVSAANDWSKPCFSGVCQYDLLATNNSASGTLKIWGSESSIGDITSAAGWSIIECSPDALQQDIRLVCKDGSSSDCARLYSNTTSSSNAVGKIVRLPENCGKNSFAVVTKAWVPQDQTIPASVASSLARRDGTTPTVQSLHLDTSFASANPSSGPVNFAIRAANIPGASGDLVTSPQQQRRSNSRIFGRGLFDFVGNAIDDITSLNDFDVNKTKTLPPIDVDKSFNLVNKNISCPPVAASVKIDVDAKAHAVASIGVAASGTILPPKITDFAIITSLTADLDGTIDMQASASGTLDSGIIKLFEVGIAGLDFPGILTIGPSFEINGQATATLDVDVDMTIGINYNIDKATLTFPPNSKQASGSAFNIGDTPLKISATPSAKASGTIEAHLIPTLNFGISALDDVVSANIFLNLDASVTMTLSAQGNASVEATVQRRSGDDAGIQDFDLLRRGQTKPGYYFWNPFGLSGRAPQVDNGGSDNTFGDSDVDASDGGSDALDNKDTDNGTMDDASDNSSIDASEPEVSGDVDNPDNINTSSNADNGEYSADSDNSSSVDVDDASSEGGDASVENDANDSINISSNAVGSTPSVGVNDTNSHDGSDDEASPIPHTADSDPLGEKIVTDNVGSTDNKNETNSQLPPNVNGTANSSTISAGSLNTGKSSLVDKTASFGGCFDIGAALDVNAGADGDFFGLFDKTTKVALFSRKFDLFKKCFGSNASRRSLRSTPFTRSLLNKRAFDLTCPSSDEDSATPISIVDQTIAAAN